MDSDQPASQPESAPATSASGHRAAAESGGGAPHFRPLHVMSFNALFQTDSTAPGEPAHWAHRAPAIEALMASERPDLLGLQEMQTHTFGPIEAGLGPAYRAVGTMGMKGGSQGLINPILFSTERFELVGWDQFWLSDTPRVIGSTTWGNTGPRGATWVRLRDRESGDELIHLNTHLDHVITQAKAHGARLIADRLRQFHLWGLPTITTGDFNSVAGGSPAYEILVDQAGLQDSWVAAEERLSPQVSTFPFFGEIEESDFRIDWILLSQGVRVLDATICTLRPEGVYPSDHLPVQAHVVMP
jgi:endonuclease/exonuclease/phosphatase family metal-dependent hydrolase